MLLRMQSDIVSNNGRAIAMLLQPMQGEQELFDSPNTLNQIEQLLMVMAQTLEHFPMAVIAQLPEIDWAGWQALHLKLQRGERPRREEVWYAVSSLVPNAVALLAQLRRRQPGWFEFGY